MDQERSPPPPPTPLDFPQCASSAKDERNTPDFETLYNGLLALRKPDDITLDYIKALNLDVISGIPASGIVPDELLKDLPPLVWEQPAESEPEKRKLMGNGSPYPPRDKYELAKTELMFDSDDAFREAARIAPKPGREKVRLTQSRKFWVGLERMSQYWDASLDQYYDTVKRPESTGDQLAADGNKVNEAESTGNPQTSEGVDTMAIDSPPAENRTLEQVYKGRRIGTGYEMPEDAREDTLRGLLEMVAWPFGCQATIPSLPPRLAVRNLLFPVRQNLLAGKAPLDRQTARKGIVEGPLLVVQCRAETSFRQAGETVGHGQMEVCDLFREVGAMLLAAQERGREGRAEVKPGEGKWWTTTPRWGGGVPNESITDEANAEGSDKDKKPEADVGNVHKRSRYANPLRSSRRGGPGYPRKMTTSERWKVLHAGPSLWDGKMKYTQVGKQKDSPFDDVSHRGVSPFSFVSFQVPLSDPVR